MEPEKEYNKIDEAKDKVLEKDIHADNVAIAETKKRKKKSISLTGPIKELIIQRVASMDQLGFTKREGAKMISDELYPNGEGEFTTKQYATWLNNIKASKLVYFDHYTRAGLVLDMIDINETMKMVYQNALREFRRECLKNKEGDRKDKSYIIKLGYLLKDLSEERQKILFSVPFVNSYKTVVDKSKGVLDDVKTNYPSLLKISDSGTISVRVSKSKSTDAGDGKEGNSESVLETATGKEAGVISTEGNVQSDTDNRSVPEANRTTGTPASERVFG